MIMINRSKLDRTPTRVNIQKSKMLYTNCHVRSHKIKQWNNVYRVLTAVNNHQIKKAA